MIASLIPQGSSHTVALMPLVLRLILACKANVRVCVAAALDQYYVDFPLKKAGHCTGFMVQMQLAACDEIFWSAKMTPIVEGKYVPFCLAFFSDMVAVQALCVPAQTLSIGQFVTSIECLLPPYKGKASSTAGH